MRRARIKRKKSGAFRIGLFFLFSLVVTAGTYVALNFDSKIMPPITATIDSTAKNRINKSIDNSLQNITNQNSLSAEDFYTKTTDESGMVNSLSVNTMLVNDVCSQLAVGVCDQLATMESTVVNVPLSVLFNIEALANIGPKFPVKLLPVGDATVDYETKFESVGINQTNFQIWLRVDSTVRIINPIQNKDIIVCRKISLVNTVFSGNVPQFYAETGRN